MSENSTCAVVTGGSGGIGVEISRLLAARGLPVAVTYRSDADRAAALVEEITAAGGRAHAARVDLADTDRVATWAQQLCAEFGEPSVLVHAAGPHIPMVHLSKVSPATYSEHLGAEATAFFALVHAFLPALRRTAGSVVAVTTAATDRYPVRDGLSAGTKGAVEALVRGFAAEEGRFGVRFNAVGPGMLTDGMAERLIGSRRPRRARPGRRNEPHPVAAASVPPPTSPRPSASSRATRPASSPARSSNVDGGYTV